MAWASSSSCWAIRPVRARDSLLETVGGGVQRGVIGLGAADLLFGGRDLLRAVADAGIRPLHLRIELGDLEDGEHLAGAHMVADIHVDLADVARDLGVQLHFLKGDELADD